MVTQSSTREDLRKAVGQALGVIREVEADASGTTTTFVTDDMAIMTADDLNGKWLIFTSGQANIDGQEAQITDSTVSSNAVTLTFFPAVTNAPDDGATAEMWDQEYRPTQVHSALNQAVDDATGYIYTPTTDISLHTGGKTRFDIPVTFESLSKVELRASAVQKILLIGGQAWSESIAASFAPTQDNEDRIFGKTASKFVFTPGSDGDLASMDVPLNDLSDMTHVEFGIKVDIAVAAGDLVLRLSEAPNGGDTDKIISIPALNVGEETWVRVPMTEAVSGFTPAEALAIISVALEYNANSKANTIWMTGIDVSQEDSYTWEEIERRLWSIDKQNRDLIFDDAIRADLGYFLIKLTGGDNPLRLTSDTDVSEIPERYMVHYAVGTLLERYNAGEDEVQAGIRSRAAARQFSMSEAAKGTFPMLVNARDVT